MRTRHLGFVFATLVLALATTNVFADCAQVGPVTVAPCPPPESSSSGSASGSSDAPVASSKAEREALALLNADRAKRGLRPLAVDARLVSLARVHAARMARAGRIWHNSRQLTSRSTRRRLDNPTILGENVGVGPRLSWVEGEFMGSRRHRSNIVDRRYSAVGVGVVVFRGSYWIVQDFLGRGSLRAEVLPEPQAGTPATQQPDLVPPSETVTGTEVSGFQMPVAASPMPEPVHRDAPVAALALLTLVSGLALVRRRVSGPGRDDWL